MTSVFLEEEPKVMKKKQRLINDVHVKDDTRSFLSFSRENLSISQSDLEQGFKKQRFRPNRNTILSSTALFIALLCLSLETWNFYCSAVNVREIEELKQSVESLKHRSLEEDLLDGLKAFEQQLFAEESTDEDLEEADPDNADYDSNYTDDEDDDDYDDSVFSTHGYPIDYHSMPKFGSKPSDFPEFSSTITPVPTPPEPEPSPDKAIIELLAAVHKIETKLGQQLKKNDKNADQDHDEKKVVQGKLEHEKNDTKWKRKRSIDEENHETNKRLSLNRRFFKNKTKRMTGFGSKSSSRKTLENTSDEQNISATVSPKYPPKKYIHADDAKSDVQNKSKPPKNIPRKFRRNGSHCQKKVVAIHYGGNRTMHSEEDNYSGNGKIRHGSSIFKAWEISEWARECHMKEHFGMASNGTITIKVAGLYLVYAQIHYHDNQSEVGFHLQVNGQSIMQCMINNLQQQRHISQTCSSTQLTYLRENDRLVLKEVGSPRYAIFDKEKSFFGLIKLGDLPCANIPDN
ncbi:TNF superfamily member 12 eiger [Xylocopa sonorina]|uniref:TNF superfamily member 12 eiger n=1 Tax=Xylocopa sonorina TaxID=1818115 RepID=UPI00403A800C